MIRMRRVLGVVSLLAIGGALGATLAIADRDPAAVIDVTVCDELLDVTGEIVLEDGRGFLAFQHGDQRVKVEVRGWDALQKRAILGRGTKVHVTGVNRDGKKVEYRGHVTVLK